MRVKSVIRDTERDIFLAAIRTAPGEVTPRLVYSDWLDERGDADAELVRLLCEIQSSDYAAGPAWERLELLVGKLPDTISRLDINRGLGSQLKRLSERDRRLFGCACAERVVPQFRRLPLDDNRPEVAITTSRGFAIGIATVEELLAAEEAAFAAAQELIDLRASTSETTMWEAMTAAAYAADAAGQAARRISDTAGAAGAAAAATWSAAAASGRPSERRWQHCRALEYRLGFVPPPEPSDAS